MKGFLDRDEEDNDITAEMGTLTTLAGDWIDSESDDDDNAEDFAMENEPRPPPSELMYGGQGKCKAPAHANNVPDACQSTPAKKRKRRGKRGGRNERRRASTKEKKANGIHARVMEPPRSGNDLPGAQGYTATQEPTRSKNPADPQRGVP